MLLVPKKQLDQTGWGNGWKLRAAFKKYDFNVEVVQAAIRYLVFKHMIRASKILEMMQKWVQMKEQHTALVEELKMMEEQVEQLQAKIVANKREVMIFKRK